MQTINTFSKGMNTDVDLSLLEKDQYLYAENLRLFTDSGNTTGSLENILGNVLLNLSTFIPETGSLMYYVCGYCNIRNELYLFITTNTTSIPTGTNNSKIIKVLFNTTGTSVSSISLIYDDANALDGSRLGFSTVNKIKAVGRYESDTIKKIYWVDGYNNIRFANVASALGNQIVNKFELIPSFILSTPQFSTFISGSLTSGKVQYAYQMYNLNGGETLFSPVSNLISISSTSGQTGSNKTFKGSDIDINTGKGIRLSISPPTGFNRIRVVSIKYNSLNGIPVINILADQNISTTPVTTYFSDTGINYLGTYTYEEFAVVGNNVFSASEIETKNDYLFVGNIQQTDWDVDYDARAYRFLSSTHPSGSAYQRKSYLRDTAFSDSPLIIDGVASPSTWNVPLTHGCINNFNEIITYNSSYEFKFKSDGVTLGGSGTNISYSFINNNIKISETGTNYLEDYSNNNDYSNENIESNYVGYQRDEIYRFGIVFFNNIGQSSTVKWIGDIRCPNIYDSGTVYELSNTIFANIQGIRFYVNSSSVISQGAKYFKIVRVQRNKEDRSILAQGMIGASVIIPVGSPLTNYYMLPTLTPVYNTTYSASGTSLTMDQTILEFNSPEINFNKDIDYQSGDIIETPGYYSNINIQGISPVQGQLIKAHSINHTTTFKPYIKSISDSIMDW